MMLSLQRFATSACRHRLRQRQHSRRYLSKTTVTLPDSANVIVIGGGVIGTSVAYHLAKIGVEDVLLLERDQLTSGTTWHAAGLMCTFGSLSSTSTDFRKYTKELYRDILRQETDMDTGFRGVGFIELATDPDRLHYFRRVSAFNRLCGVPVKEISPEEVHQRFPLCRTEDVLAGFMVDDDGRVNPYDVTMAMAKAAKQYGATIREGVTIEKVLTEYKPKDILPSVTAVTTTTGESISANVVVNCAGMWARQLGETCGVAIPNQAAEHYYLITDTMPEVDPDWPVIEDGQNYTYIRPEGGGLMLGLFEGEGAAWKETSIPSDFSFGEIEPDWDRMAPYLEAAMERVPAALQVGAKKFFCGPESFTPDGGPVIGEAPELRNFYVAAGLNSIGILSGGGIGQLMARWIQAGHAPDDVDVTGININRFQKYQSNRSYRKERVKESLGNTYKVHYPDHQPYSCRGAKQSPLHNALLPQRPFFRDVSGWESPSWYALRGEPIVEKESFRRESWFSLWEAEHTACRESVALFDMSFMSKFLVQGHDAGKFLNQLSTANIDGDCNTITYTQWLNERGNMKADLTVTKLSDQNFLVVATDTMHNHVLNHMQSRLSSELHAFVTDVTGKYAQINLQGPKARDLLQTLTSVDLSNDSFPFRQAKEIDICLARVLCMRITYVGELGYELFIPAEQACHVYYQILKEAEKFNLHHAGLRALGSLRLEKGYRDYGHDMDNTDTLLECGLGFTCDFSKDFIGKDQVLQQKHSSKEAGGLMKRMVSILLEDPEPLMHHGEVLWRNGERISDIRAASYGHTLGGAIGLSMLESTEPINKSFINREDNQWEVEIAEQRYPCTVSLAPLYDPKNTKIKL